MFYIFVLRIGNQSRNDIHEWYSQYIYSERRLPEPDIYWCSGGRGWGIYGWVIWQAKTYASQIAGVGVEGALQGAAAMGIGAATFGASRMAGGALGMGKNAGLGAWKGVRRQEGGLGQSNGLSGKLGNLTGQGINIGAKKLRSAAIEMAKKNMVAK